VSKRAKERLRLAAGIFRDTEWYAEKHTVLWTDPRGVSGGLTHTSWAAIPDEILPSIVARDGHAHLGTGPAHLHLARDDNAPPLAYPSILAHESLHAALLDLAKRAGSTLPEILQTADRDLLVANAAIDAEYWASIETAGVTAVSRPSAWVEHGYLGRLDSHWLDEEDLAHESTWTIEIATD
jgi:hypothetical protein